MTGRVHGVRPKQATWKESELMVITQSDTKAQPQIVMVVLKKFWDFYSKEEKDKATE